MDGVRLFRVQGISLVPGEGAGGRDRRPDREVATNPALGADSLRIEESDVATQIVAGGQLVMSVFDMDAALEGGPRTVIARLYLSKIKAAVSAYRTDRQHPALEWAAVWALAGTAGLRAAAARDPVDRPEGRRPGRTATPVTASRPWPRCRATSSARPGSRRRCGAACGVLRAVVVLALGFSYLEWVLGLFPHTRSVARSLAGYILDPLATMWASFVATLPDLFFLAVLFVVVRIGLRLLRRFFDSVAEGRTRLANFDPEWARPTYKLVRPLVIAFAARRGLPLHPGVELGRVQGRLGLPGRHALPGVVVVHRQPDRRLHGDLPPGVQDRRRVQIGDVMGFVTAVRMLDTHLRTFKNENVAVPNSQLLNSHITNYSALAKTSGVILHTIAGIGYETPWRQVEAMLLEAARRTPGAKTDPPPFVLQLKLDDFCVQYELNVHISEPLLILETYTELHRNVLDVFNEYGVQIMTPSYMKDPDAPKVVPPNQWYLAPATPAGAEGAAAAPKPRGAAFT